MKTIPIIDFNPFDELHLDLDGCFADFEKRVKLISGHTPSELKALNKGLWKFIKEDKLFFASLEMMPDAEYLWLYCKQYKPSFLTGAPPGERAQQQKKDWVKEKFGPEYTTIVLPKKDKQLHAGHMKVLIDDTHSNVIEWTNAGGISVHHSNVWDTIEQMEELRHKYKHGI